MVYGGCTSIRTTIIIIIMHEFNDLMFQYTASYRADGENENALQ